jgi:hypothetical protein
MEKIKKALRFMALVCLVALASIGMVMSAPPPPPVRRQNTIEAVAEDEENDNEDETSVFKW